MASTGPALWPGATTFPGTNVFPGQDTLPIVRCRISFDDVSVSTPTWSEQTLAGQPNRIRSYSVSRGRASELDGFDAGTSTIVFDNRDRSLDPAVNASVRPLNRVWLYEEFSGEVHDLFHGYAESWTQNWDASGIVDATATVQAADEFKVLSLTNLPTYDPPRSSYADLIGFDQPSDYWPMGDPSSALTVGNAAGGDSMAVVAGSSGQALANVANYPIVGDNPANLFSSAIGNSTNTATWGYLSTPAIGDSGGSGDLPGSSEFAVELWFQFSAFPAATDFVLIGTDDSGTNNKYSLQISSAGVLTLTGRNSTPSNIGTSGGALLAGTWYHLVGTVESGSLRLYVNGAQANSVAWSGTFPASRSATSSFRLGQPTGTIPNMYYSNVAFYRHGLTASRVLAHYNAGVNRGYPAQASGARVGAVLDTISSRAPRSLATGVRTVAGDTMSQPAVNPIRSAVSAEAIDSGFLVRADGTAQFLASNHRSSAPYNTVQMIFDDDGTDSPYLDATLDYSEAFLFNEWNVTRDQGTVQTTSDATSIARYYKRSQSVTGLLLTTDADSATVAAAQLAKYKDPFTRVTSIKPKMADAETCRLVFQRDLMDRIEFFRTPPGGGARIDQVLFIQKIDINGAPGLPPDVTLGVSPL